MSGLGKVARMAQAPAGIGDHVYLDATHMGTEFYDRFPSITAACRSAATPARTHAWIDATRG